MMRFHERSGSTLSDSLVRLVIVSYGRRRSRRSNAPAPLSPFEFVYQSFVYEVLLTCGEFSG